MYHCGWAIEVGRVRGIFRCYRMPLSYHHGHQHSVGYPIVVDICEDVYSRQYDACGEYMARETEDAT